MNRAACRQRVKAQAFARYGLELGKQVRLDLLHRVHNGDVKYARMLTRSRTVIVLDHLGAEIAFIYSNVHREIISFLAADARETAEWRKEKRERG
jgi:hypothetical protein